MTIERSVGRFLLLMNNGWLLLSSGRSVYRLRLKEGLSVFFFFFFFFYLGFYVAFNTVQVISRRVVGRAEETSTYSSLGFCTVNCRPTASNSTG